MLVKLFLLLLTRQIWGLPPNFDGFHPRIVRLNDNRNILESCQLQGDLNYWRSSAQQTLLDKLKTTVNQNVAKNVIIFLGDGMSMPTISAARVYQGGEETQLAFEKFPYVGLSKTYAVNTQVPDSANTATAYLTGVKGNMGTIGVGPAVKLDDCRTMTNTSNWSYSIAYYSQLENKRTGVVSTARITHASPAGAYAHTANRDWEADSDVEDAGEDPTVCKDIAAQLVRGATGKNLDVILGGGRRNFLSVKVQDEDGKKGLRNDDANLIAEWLDLKLNNARYVSNRDDLLNLSEEVDSLLGLFTSGHMSYNLDRDETKEPSLAEMTETAIKVLSKGENGYFLFVEGARIDTAHHDNRARLALDETIEFSKAVQRAVDLTDQSDTLIVVTADHAHSMGFSGYARKGHDIFEFAGKGSDKIVYTTLTYANGPGYHDPDKGGARHDVTDDKYTKKKFQFPAYAPLDSATHGGDDVAIYARGPWAHLFTGVLEQNVIPHLMSYASCVGTGYTACKQQGKNT